MSTFIPEEIKSRINKEYLKLFPIETMEEEMFIPINSKDDTIYVVIANAENKDKRNYILTKIILTTRLKPKVMSLTKEQFNDLLEYCKKSFGLKSRIEAKSQDNIFDLLQIALRKNLNLRK